MVHLLQIPERHFTGRHSDERCSAERRGANKKNIDNIQSHL
jgi:hypothetical protein